MPGRRCSIISGCYLNTPAWSLDPECRETEMEVWAKKFRLEETHFRQLVSFQFHSKRRKRTNLPVSFENETQEGQISNFKTRNQISSGYCGRLTNLPQMDHSYRAAGHLPTRAAVGQSTCQELELVSSPGNCSSQAWPFQRHS